MRSLGMLTISMGLVLLTGAALGAAAEKAEAPKAPAKKPRRRPRKPNPTMAPIQDVSSLPRVLLIGDSISIGYTLPTRALLKGKANLHRIPTNGGPTTRGLASLDKWLGKGKWDVIHFNWGLHDLKHLKDGKLDLAGERLATPQQYEKNLRELVRRLKKTKAKLIWCSTTPVPEGAGGRRKGDEVAYNRLAAKVMKEQKVAVDDLYAFALPRLKKIQRPKNVHFTPAGSQTLAREVANHILVALGRKPLPSPKPTTRPAAK